MGSHEISYAEYRTIGRGSGPFIALIVALLLVIVAGLAAAHTMDSEGHHITGMNNRIVWGLPHVFAIFLIVAASGALNIASLSSVFKRKRYTPLARLSAVMAIALLAGGLMVLVLDLGRPDRLIIALTHYNPVSVFAWNVMLYSVFITVSGIYLGVLLAPDAGDPKRARWVSGIGIVALSWRLALTTGTGCIFGFLVARQAYDAAIMAPLFVAMSLSSGMAVFILVLCATAYWAKRPQPGAAFDATLGQLARLQGIFVALTSYFVIVRHLTNLYAAEHGEIERFLLIDGGLHPAIFWIGQILLGTLTPLALLLGIPWLIAKPPSAKRIVLAAGAVVIGGFAWLHGIVIGGQAAPLEIFPGKEIIEGDLIDGNPVGYSPTLPEFLLGLGGVASALLIIVIALRLLRILPKSLSGDADETDAVPKVSEASGSGL
ncbi:NrfD/PsrC family molybdoenzyme membrane anchor subunit [Thioalkalivibrio sp. HK1]|uniref:NrfD/PsrC family molybdoenzyme membrane anchor subunit n=1 Tax=Thioalkalivibrio sp. HK1 TaxID=1469245 RepID=UPI0004B2E6B0|nr:NrfD/PsrC family molybdoenzyme membrane anchor subunit [Thioalkalivibrio sp. HK1]